MKTLRQILLASSIALMPFCLNAQDNHRWTLEKEGHIRWQPE